MSSGSWDELSIFLCNQYRLYQEQVLFQSTIFGLFLANLASCDPEDVPGYVCWNKFFRAQDSRKELAVSGRGPQMRHLRLRIRGYYCLY